jgi:type II secretory pathway pseudopilin PulG
MRNRLQVLGTRFQGKIKSLFSHFLTPGPYRTCTLCGYFFSQAQEISRKVLRRCAYSRLTWHLAPAAAAPQRGFTLIELTVSVALFIVVMLVAVGALLALVDANRKARALESVINNLNITLDGMVRAIRMGSIYNCGGADVPNPATGANCASGGTSFSFAPYGSDAGDQTERVVYTFSNGQLFRSMQGGSNPIAVTAPEVSINSMTFYVVGTVVGDTAQPKVVMVVKGTAGASNKTRTTFYIQATGVQRTLDI